MFMNIEKWSLNEIKKQYINLFTEKDVNSEEEQEEEEMNEGVEEEALSVIEIVAAHREQVNQKKLEIAQLSIDIVENPYEKVLIITTKFISNN